MALLVDAGCASRQYRPRPALTRDAPRLAGARSGPERPGLAGETAATLAGVVTPKVTGAVPLSVRPATGPRNISMTTRATDEPDMERITIRNADLRQGGLRVTAHAHAKDPSSRPVMFSGHTAGSVYGDEKFMMETHDGGRLIVQRGEPVRDFDTNDTLSGEAMSFVDLEVGVTSEEVMEAIDADTADDMGGHDPRVGRAVQAEDGERVENGWEVMVQAPGTLFNTDGNWFASLMAWREDIGAMDLVDDFTADTKVEVIEKVSEAADGLEASEVPK